MEGESAPAVLHETPRSNQSKAENGWVNVYDQFPIVPARYQSDMSDAPFATIPIAHFMLPKTAKFLLPLSVQNGTLMDITPELCF